MMHPVDGAGMLLRSVIGLLALLWPLFARAAGIAVANASFESPAVAPGTFSTLAPPPGWTNFGNVNYGWRTIGVVNPNSTQLYLDPVPHGSNVGVTFLGPTFSNSPAGLQQTLGTSLQARTTYTLTVAVGNMASDPNPPHNAFNFVGFPGYRVELLAGGFVVAADHNTLLPGDGRFATAMVRVATSSTHTNIGLPLGLRLINLDAAAGIEVNFDDVRLDAVPTPDPAVTIGIATNGFLRIDFTEFLQESGDLHGWTNVAPQPVSPWFRSADAPSRFYRASE